MSGTIHDETLLSETQAINSSLTALGMMMDACLPAHPSNSPLVLTMSSVLCGCSADVLSALSSKSKDLWLVPYRNSKLTHLLRDSLGGNAKTVLVAHCQTDITQYRQSKVCLMYATRAKLIRNRPRANLVAADQSELQAKLVLIERLKSQLAAQHTTLETLQERQVMLLPWWLYGSVGDTLLPLMSRRWQLRQRTTRCRLLWQSAQSPPTRRWMS